MFQRASTLDQVNDRIDQEARNVQRQKWEIAVATWKSQSTLARGLVESDTKPARSAAGAGASAADPILFEAMAERLNYLERKASRLESELRAWERTGRFRRQALLWSLGVASLLLVIGLIARFVVSSSPSRRPLDAILELHDSHAYSGASRAEVTSGK